MFYAYLSLFVSNGQYKQQQFIILSAKFPYLHIYNFGYLANLSQASCNIQKVYIS